MKSAITTKITGRLAFVAVIASFVLFTNFEQPEEKKDKAAATNCCSGYTVAMSKLRKFMLDSLPQNISFEGGVYSKADLLAAINYFSGDSIYLMNTLKNCSISQGTSLAITSRYTTGVAFVGGYPCKPCPQLPCCPQRVCVAKINRSCINYASSFFSEPETGAPSNLVEQ